MNQIEIVGFAAAILMMISSMPQVLKTLKTKSATDISLVMWSTSAAGLSLWLIYAIVIASPSLAINAAVSLVLSVTMVILAYKYGGKLFV